MKENIMNNEKKVSYSAVLKTISENYRKYTFTAYDIATSLGLEVNDHTVNKIYDTLYVLIQNKLIEHNRHSSSNLPMYNFNNANFELLKKPVVQPVLITEDQTEKSQILNELNRIVNSLSSLYLRVQNLNTDPDASKLTQEQLTHALLEKLKET